MGGYGSGRWYRGGTKETVERSWVLDVNWLTREGLFDQDNWRSGSIRWSDARTGEETSSIGYVVDVTGRCLRLHYRLPDLDEDFNYTVQVTTSPLAWGGVRWWFICPLICNGHHCGRRVGKIYLPRHRRYYGCRHCYDLTYQSCQESHTRDDMWRHLASECGTDPETARLMWEGNPRDELRREREAAKREQRRRRGLQRYSVHKL